MARRSSRAVALSSVLVGGYGIDENISSPSNKAIRIHLGSCNDNKRDWPQPFWSVVEDRNPDAFFWTGDVVYGDGADGENGEPIDWERAASEKELIDLYSRQRNHEGYSRAVASKAGKGMIVDGTWDDHDVGQDNCAGDTFDAPSKEARKAALLDFLEAPPSDPRRQRGHGMFTVRSVGPVDVILLDTRFYRQDAKAAAAATPALSGPALFLTNWIGGLLDRPHPSDDVPKSLPPSAPLSSSPQRPDLLGEVQWRWLEAHLATSTARVHVIVSSVQVLPDGRTDHHEGWHAYPHEYQRLVQMLAEHRVASPLLVSGDVHWAELAAHTCTANTAAPQTAAVYTHKEGEGEVVPPAAKRQATLAEMTSSGLTHAVGGYASASHDGWFLHQTKYWFMLIHQMFLGATKWMYQYPGALYLGMNLGELDVDMAAETVTARVLNEAGRPVLEQTWHFAELDFGNVLDPQPAQNEACARLNKTASTFSPSFLFPSSMGEDTGTHPFAHAQQRHSQAVTCVPHRGNANPTAVFFGHFAALAIFFVPYLAVVIAMGIAILAAIRRGIQWSLNNLPSEKGSKRRRIGKAIDAKHAKVVAALEKRQAQIRSKRMQIFEAIDAKHVKVVAALEKRQAQIRSKRMQIAEAIDAKHVKVVEALEKRQAQIRSQRRLIVKAIDSKHVKVVGALEKKQAQIAKAIQRKRQLIQAIDSKTNAMLPSVAGALGRRRSFSF